MHDSGAIDPAEARGPRAVRIAVATNLLLVLVKCTAGVAGRSSALVADGVESLSDVLSSLLAYGALRISSRPPDEHHPYGHGKAEPVVALAIAGTLVGAAIAIAVESLHQIRSPHPLPAPFTLGVLALVIPIKMALSSYTARAGRAAGSTVVSGDAAHHFADAMTSALAFAGISIGLWTRLSQADAWAALLAVPVILFTAIRQVREPLDELLDVAQPAMEARIRQIAARVPGVEALDKCLVRKAGRHFYADLHVAVDATLSVRAGHAIAHDVQAAVRAADPRIVDVLVHIEPA